jgi:WD40 repeat protein
VFLVEKYEDTHQLTSCPFPHLLPSPSFPLPFISFTSSVSKNSGLHSNSLSFPLTTWLCARQVTACEFADDGMTVFTGGLDNEIKVWDMKMDEVSA